MGSMRPGVAPTLENGCVTSRTTCSIATAASSAAWQTPRPSRLGPVRAPLSGLVRAHPPRSSLLRQAVRQRRLLPEYSPANDYKANIQRRPADRSPHRELSGSCTRFLAQAAGGPPCVAALGLHRTPTYAVPQAGRPSPGASGRSRRAAVLGVVAPLRADVPVSQPMLKGPRPQGVRPRSWRAVALPLTGYHWSKCSLSWLAS